jgi:hypothetical protein
MLVLFSLLAPDDGTMKDILTECTFIKGKGEAGDMYVVVKSG